MIRININDAEQGRYPDYYFYASVKTNLLTTKTGSLIPLFVVGSELPTAHISIVR
jgi:hypothetical protein